MPWLIASGHSYAYSEQAWLRMLNADFAKGARRILGSFEPLIHRLGQDEALASLLALLQRHGWDSSKWTSGQLHKHARALVEKQFPVQLSLEQ